MTEHVRKCRHPDGHEWRVTFKSMASDNLYGACTRCPALLPIADAERRLNATERLRAEIVWKIITNKCCEGYVQDALKAYANILEGK